MKTLRIAAASLLAIASIPSMAAANSPHLSWQPKFLRGADVEACLSVARIAIERHRWLTTAQRDGNALWAYGDNDGLTVSIGCFHVEGGTIAMVMVAGQEPQPTRKLRDSLIAQWPIPIDSGAVGIER